MNLESCHSNHNPKLVIFQAVFLKTIAFRARVITFVTFIGFDFQGIACIRKTYIAAWSYTG